ncbi:Uncharacterised protein [Salmonella enterica subsp. arizonae]|uniref:Uncharacterized protein n=2 Tax=Salmonella enterica TaxID=28901 RepID=A0A447R2K7_SALER|nr:Uncharacterised protein [Salmonella enterica subsp. diarizonae]SUG55116.1 Uncharacterised protein [Salmonella enterica subsp. diarizonae]SUG60431.1 Uncharacterised protein [Salmonella enterica subsp. arizonae]VEA76428.1 Uncharacterised protein [Salmonella enterica subsp. arizonae]VFS70669.1 Uncharacterised protein [Salmonella enterica subsp. diarizonae]
MCWQKCNNIRITYLNEKAHKFYEKHHSHIVFWDLTSSMH